MDKDVLIVGAGPVGLFAGFQAGMLGMKTVIVDNLDMKGGQCSALYPEKPIYDIPGYPEIAAQDLVDNLAKQANIFNPDYLLSTQIEKIEKKEDDFLVSTNKGEKITVKVIIIAAGCGAFVANKPPLKDIESYEDKSVFYDVRNRNLFTDKTVAIAGGGDSAIDWALNLSDIASKIYLIHRRDKFRATPAMVEKVKNNNKIEILTPYQLSSIEGNDGQIDHINLESIQDQSICKVKADILLPFFGLKMSLGPILNWGLNIHRNHIEVKNTYYQTNIDGIYAIGDIASYEGKLKLILTGFAEASSALHHAYPKVFAGKKLHFEYSTSKGLPTN